MSSRKKPWACGERRGKRERQLVRQEKNAAQRAQICGHVYTYRGLFFEP